MNKHTIHEDDIEIRLSLSFRVVVGVVFSCLSLLSPPSAGAASTNLPVEVKTQWYRIVIDPARGGRITEWKPAGSATNLAHTGQGIGSVTRTDMAQNIGFDLPLSAEVIRSGGQTEVILSTLPGSLEVQGNLSYRKKYIFRADTPVVQVQVELTNHSAGGIIGWRMYNDISVAPEGQATVFQEREDTAARTEKMWAENNPADARKWNIWESAGSGWGGVDTGLGQSVFFWTAPAGVCAIYSYASPEYAAYELRMQEPIDRGETITRTFFITAVETGNPHAALKTLKSELPPDLAGVVAAGSAAGEFRKVHIEHEANTTEGQDKAPPRQSDRWHFGGPSGIMIGYNRYLNQPPHFTGQHPALANYDMGVGFDTGAFANWYRGNAIRVLINGADIFAQKPARQLETKEGSNGYLRMVWELDKGGELILNFTVPEDGHAIYARVDIVPGELSIKDIQVRLNCYPGGFGPKYKQPSHRRVVTAKGKWEVPPDFKPSPEKPFPEAPFEKGAEWIFYADKLQSAGSLGLLIDKEECPSGRVRMSGYGQRTELNYPADTRQIHLAFYAFETENKTSREAFISSLDGERSVLTGIH